MFDNDIDKVKIIQLGIEYDAKRNGKKPVGGRFYIPKYQRGYRWTQLQVGQLLNDILEFDNKNCTDNQYCLQPVVVQKKAETEQWVVVDGQQRLTTIFIVLSCLRCIEGRKKKAFYEKREWYHLIGYLIAANEFDSKKNDIEETLYKLSGIYQYASKPEFTRELKKRILSSIMRLRANDDENLERLAYGDLKDSFGQLNYDGGLAARNRIHKILLLFNVVTEETSKESMSRFPFHEYKKTIWNLEHIHSVTTAIPANEKDCREWAEKVWQYLESVHYFRDDENKNISERLGKMLANGKGFSRDNQEFMDLFTDISETFSAGKLSSDQLEELENGIMNLALLDEHTNKSYKNSIFPMKRKFIMDKMGKDDFVPICTKNVFLKYYTGEVTQFYVWDENDRKCYFEKMCSVIYEYLTGNKAATQALSVQEDR